MSRAYREMPRLLRFRAVFLLGVAVALLGDGCGGGAKGGACDPAKKFQCVPSMCGGDVLDDPVCDHGAWKCTNGWVPIDQCPPDACFEPPVDCCCDSGGKISYPTCPGHGGEVCKAGTFLCQFCDSQCPPAGQFPCNDTTCKLGVEYCRVSAGKGACEPLPAACGSPPDCACLASACTQCWDNGIGALECAD